MESLRKTILSVLMMRRRWMLILSFFFCTTGGIFLSITTPRIYEADTLILVEPKSIPDKYMAPITEVDVKQRVSTITLQIKSRTYIEQVIKDAGLFATPEYRNMLLEEKVASVRKNMKVEVTIGRKGTDSFKISYKGTDPEKIAKTVNILAGIFIDESVRVMQAEVVGARDFLDAELGAMADKLVNVETSLREYRKIYMGGLPEQLGSNLKMLDGLYMHMDAKQAELRNEKLMMFQARDEKQLYERADENIRLCKEDISKILLQISAYERRIEDTPKREQEMMSLKRNYENIRDSYESMLDKKLDADLAVSMERKGKGSRFRILDRARMPRKPISPDIRKLFLRSLAASFLVGFGLIFLMEFVGWLRGAVPKSKPDGTVWRHRGRQIMTILFIMMDFALLMFFFIMSIKGVDSFQALIMKMIMKMFLDIG